MMHHNLINDLANRTRQEDLLREAAMWHRAMEAESAATQTGLLAALRRRWRRPPALYKVAGTARSTPR